MVKIIYLAVALALAPTLTACDSGGGARATAREDGDVEITTVVSGSGETPNADDVALINYKGMLADGTVFDQGQQAAMPLDGVIPGLSQALLKMQRGGKYLIRIPSSLAYGDQKNGPIPENSELKFEIEFLDFKSKSEVAALMESGPNGETVRKRNLGHNQTVASQTSSSSASSRQSIRPLQTQRTSIDYYAKITCPDVNNVAETFYFSADSDLEAMNEANRRTRDYTRLAGRGCQVLSLERQ